MRPMGPYCIRQLADFQTHIEEFKKENVEIVALSVDPLDKARETVDKLQLTFPVAYGLAVPRDADKVGAFWEERRKIIHATDFILDTDKKVVDASYSIGLTSGRDRREEPNTHRTNPQGHEAFVRPRFGPGIAEKDRQSLVAVPSIPPI